MADRIVTLHTPPAQADIVRGLRSLADRLEQDGAAGEGMDAITTVMVLLGHSNSKPSNDGSGDLDQSCQWQLYSWGPRTDPFTTRGLLATVMRGH